MACLFILLSSLTVYQFEFFILANFIIPCVFYIVLFSSCPLGIFSLTPFTSSLFPQFKSLLKRSFCVLQLNPKHIFTHGSALLVFFTKLYHPRRYWACLTVLCVCCCLFVYIVLLQGGCYKRYGPFISKFIIILFLFRTRVILGLYLPERQKYRKTSFERDEPRKNSQASSSVAEKKLCWTIQLWKGEENFGDGSGLS